MPDDALSSAFVVGKLPFHGDFITRGAGVCEPRRIDRWLAKSMAIARDQWGPLFEETFDAASPWRFAWRDGNWSAGALAPSVDSSGRRFPLLVGRSGLSSRQVEAGAKLCESAAGEAICRGWSADQLLEAVAGDVAGDGPDAVQGWWNEDCGDGARLKDQLPSAILSHILAASPVTGASA